MVIKCSKKSLAKNRQFFRKTFFSWFKAWEKSLSWTCSEDQVCSALRRMERLWGHGKQEADCTGCIIGVCLPEPCVAAEPWGAICKLLGEVGYLLMETSQDSLDVTAGLKLPVVRWVRGGSQPLMQGKQEMQPQETQRSNSSLYTHRHPSGILEMPPPRVPLPFLSGACSTYLMKCYVSSFLRHFSVLFLFSGSGVSSSLQPHAFLAVYS